MKLIFSIIILLISISFVSAFDESQFDFTYTTPINYSTIATVNNSNFWDDLDTPTDIEYTDVGGDSFWDGDIDMTPYSITLDTFFGDWGGGNIDSNVDMDNNNLETTGNITADTYFGDGSQLTGIASGVNGTNLNVLGINATNITADTYFVDHIAEKTKWNGVVFDSNLRILEKCFVTEGTRFRFKYFEGGIFKDFVYNLADNAFSQDINSDVVHLGTSTNKWNDLHLSGDANIGGDALVDGGVNATYFNGTFYGDGSRLIGITGVNASFNQTFTDSLYSTQSQLLILLANESIVGCGLNMQMGDLKWSNNSLETVCWKVANGTAGTTDLRQQQLLSASALFAQGSSGGSYQGLGTHSHSLSAYGSGLQNSGIGQYVGGGMWGYGSTVYVTGTTDSAQSPPYYTQYLKQCMCDGLI